MSGREGYPEENENVPSEVQAEARSKAREMYAEGSDDDIEIDDKAAVIESGAEGSYWVQAWVFVRGEDLK